MIRSLIKLVIAHTDRHEHIQMLYRKQLKIITRSGSSDKYSSARLFKQSKTQHYYFTNKFYGPKQIQILISIINCLIFALIGLGFALYFIFNVKIQPIPSNDHIQSEIIQIPIQFQRSLRILYCKYSVFNELSRHLIQLDYVFNPELQIQQGQLQQPLNIAQNPIFEHQSQQYNFDQTNIFLSQIQYPYQYHSSHELQNIIEEQPFPTFQSDFETKNTELLQSIHLPQLYSQNHLQQSSNEYEKWFDFGEKQTNVSAGEELAQINQSFRNDFNQQFQIIPSNNLNNFYNLNVQSLLPQYALTQQQQNILPQQAVEQNLVPLEAVEQNQPRFKPQYKQVTCQCQALCQRTPKCNCFKNNEPCGPDCGCKKCPNLILPDKQSDHQSEPSIDESIEQNFKGFQFEPMFLQFN